MEARAAAGRPPFRDYLAGHLDRALLPIAAAIHVLSTDYGPPPAGCAAGPRWRPLEHLSGRHAVLIYLQRAPGGSENDAPGGARAIALGITLWEYSRNDTGAKARAYIQYVDSTGLHRAAAAAGAPSAAALAALILGPYLAYCREVLALAAVHLCAAPRAALLFRGSERLPLKGALDGPRLAAWWMALLHACLAGPAACHVYAVGEEAMPAFAAHLRRTIAALSLLPPSPSKGAPTWNYGLPYGEDDLAAHAIPLFEDDPKWRHYEAIIGGGGARADGDRMTVGDFFKVMAIRSEFQQTPSAFITVTLGQPDDCIRQGLPAAPHRSPAAPHRSPTAPHRSPTAPHRSPAKDSKGVAADPCALLERLLGRLSFATEQDAARSSARIYSALTAAGATPILLDAVAAGKAAPTAGGGAIYAAIHAAISPPPVVTNVQRLVRRRHRTDSPRQA